MIKVIGGLLYQWDTGRKIKIVPGDGTTVDEAHFSNGLQEALVVEPYTEGGGSMQISPISSCRISGRYLRMWSCTMIRVSRLFVADHWL